ncbi:hypothetical protein GGQ99_001993 [Aminobacter niigataensis]|uniref:Uncharacterized protein n=1 Tax=Aminobacter niigataensis TaxID=83265 RepID=A0ABR6L0B1_9HYPH|nr:hypothetical protein [Aminobacter niigataensis]
MLKVVFGHHAIARALRVARQRGVFFGDLLRGATDLYVRTVALVVARKRVWTLAVAVIIIVVAIVIIVVVTTAHAPVLLLWPHQILFVLNSSERGHLGGLPFRIFPPVIARNIFASAPHAILSRFHVTCRTIPARS